MEGKLKLTGLTKLAMDARANIDGLVTDYRAFNEKAKGHRADVRGLAEQIGEMDTDLTSSVNILGNSVASSNAGASQDSQPKPPSAPIAPPVIPQGEPPQASPTVTAAPPDAGFHGFFNGDPHTR